MSIGNFGDPDVPVPVADTTGTVSIGNFGDPDVPVPVADTTNSEHRQLW